MKIAIRKFKGEMMWCNVMCFNLQCFAILRESEADAKCSLHYGGIVFVIDRY